MERPIEYKGIKYTVENIMDKPKYYFSKKILKCFYCKEDVTMAAYSKTTNSGYFKTMKGMKHAPGCLWEVSTYVPKNPTDKLFNRYFGILNKGTGKKPATLVSKTFRGSSATKTIKSINIKPGKKLNIGDNAIFMYRGKINNVGKHATGTYLSLFVDSENRNVRIFIPGEVKLHRTHDVGIVIIDGKVLNSSSMYYPGVDIHANSTKNFRFEIH